MVDINTAKINFENYLNDYDRENDKIRLKIVHTYGVVDYSAELARRMRLPEEDARLAELIALLHDIGRFEQIKRFDSFQPDTMDHASYGVQLLFENGMIRRFIKNPAWDTIIRTAIARHSDFKLDGINDNQTLLHARLIRDSDKLDNCRVKLEEPIETFMDVSAGEVGREPVSPSIVNSFFRNECVLSSDRVTKMDHWVSFMAYYFDLNFRESLDIIEEQDFLHRILLRIPYTNPDTLMQITRMEAHMQDYIHHALR